MKVIMTEQELSATNEMLERTLMIVEQIGLSAEQMNRINALNEGVMQLFEGTEETDLSDLDNLEITLTVEQYIAMTELNTKILEIVFEDKLAQKALPLHTSGARNSYLVDGKLIDINSQEGKDYADTHLKNLK